jgi:hypothetical protein
MHFPSLMQGENHPVDSGLSHGENCFYTFFRSQAHAELGEIQGVSSLYTSCARCVVDKGALSMQVLLCLPLVELFKIFTTKSDHKLPLFFTLFALKM